MTEKALAIKEGNPNNLIELALTQGADLEKLEKLLTIRERWEEGEAKKAFVEAMTAFKADPPEIDKTKHVKFGQTEYYHADLADAAKKINTALSKHGLSAAWVTNQTNGTISVTCKITHIMGHSEETTLTSEPDGSGGKNSIQAIGSAVTYLQRYTLLALTGLATKDMDNDGAGAVTLIDGSQLSTIVDLMNDREVDERRFLEYMGVAKLEEIQSKDYQRAIAAIKAKKK